jgi:hypothetical protein
MGAIVCISVVMIYIHTVQNVCVNLGFRRKTAGARQNSEKYAHKRTQ